MTMPYGRSWNGIQDTHISRGVERNGGGWLDEWSLDTHDTSVGAERPAPESVS